MKLNLALYAATLFLFSCAQQNKKNENELPQFSLEQLGFKKTASQNNINTDAVHYENKNGDHFFLTKTSTSLADTQKVRFFQSRKNYITSLFQSDSDPYFSNTTKSACTKELNLEGTKSQNAQHEALTFNLPATENFVFGLCDPAVEVLHSEIIFLFCKKNKSTYELKLFKSPQLKKENKINLDEICELP